MKIMQIINAHGKERVKYKFEDGSTYQEPIVGYALVNEEELTYISPLVLNADGSVETLSEIERCLEIVEDWEVVWDEA